MQLGRIAVIAFSFQLLAFNLAQAAWQESNFGPPWCDVLDTSVWNPCSLPINVSDIFQTKTGQLFINNDLTARRLIVPNSVGPSGARVMIGDGARDNPDDTAILDVDGQIRIRGLDLSLPGNKVLTSNANGLAEWTNTLDNQFLYLKPWTGIILTDTANGGECKAEVGKPPVVCRIDVATTSIQRRITGACPPNEAIVEVKQDGTVTCRQLVSSITTDTNSGLSLSGGGGGGGPLSLSVNAGAGLIVGGSLFVDPPWPGSGLVSSNLKFDTLGCSGSNVYWKYNAVSNIWSCGQPPGPRPPGESIMYLKRMSDLGAPPVCPAGWFNLLGGNVYTTEYAGAFWNNVRICGRSVATDLCQTMYLTHSTNLAGNCSWSGSGTPALCPSIASGWNEAALNVVYAPGTLNPPTCGKVRTCYKCN